MNRRDFIEKAVRGVVVLSGGALLRGISKTQYASVTTDDIKLRFAIASDGHYGQPGTEYDQFHDDMMNWLIKEHAHSPLTCCIFNGDLIHDNTSYFSLVKKKYDTLPVPYYVSRGNHDRCDLATWRSAWNCDFNHTFEINDCGFIIMDTSNITGEYLCPDVNWAKDALHKYRSKKHLFVCMHITPLKWTKNGIECADLVKSFTQQKNLRAIFHGHDHDQDNAKIKDGKPYFFDSHIGGNWGTDYRGYRIVEVLKSNEIITYQVNPVSISRVNTNSILG